MRFRSLIALSLLAMTASLHAGTGAVPIDDLGAPVSAGSTFTYRRLVANVFNGIRENPETQKWETVSEKVLRQIGTKDRTDLPPDTPLVSFEALHIRGDGKRYLVLLIDAETDESFHPGGGASVLAVFPEGSAEPQDVADVKEDMFTSFDDPAVFPLGPDDGFFIANSHNNSSQGYLITTLFQIRGGRLHAVDSVFTLNERAICGQSFDEKLEWRTEGDPHSAYPTIVERVTRTPVADESDDNGCEEPIKPVKHRVFTGRFRFDKAKDRYEPAGGDMDQLAAFNKQNL